MYDLWDYFFNEVDAFIVEAKELHVNIVSRINLINKVKCWFTVLDN